MLQLVLLLAVPLCTEAMTVDEELALLNGHLMPLLHAAIGMQFNESCGDQPDAPVYCADDHVRGMLR